MSRFLSLLLILLTANLALASGGSDLDSPTLPASYSFKRFQTKTNVTSTALGMVVGRGVFYGCVNNQPKAPFTYQYNSSPETIVNTSTTYSTHSYSAATEEGATAQCDIDVDKKRQADSVLIKHKNWQYDLVLFENFFELFTEELLGSGRKYPGSGTINNLTSWSPFNDYRGCVNQASLTLQGACSITDLKEIYRYKVIDKNLGTVVGYPDAPLTWHSFVVIYTSETWGPIYILDSWNGLEGKFITLGGAEKAKFRQQYLTE